MGRNSRYDFLRRELETYPLPEEAVNARLRRVYAELPETLPVKRHMPQWARHGLCTAASLLAVCGLLLGVNGVNPAFAESLPLVGSIFQSINDKGHLPAENRGHAKDSLGAFATAVGGEGGHTVEIPCKNPLASPMTAALKEVYYDGSFVFAGLELRLDTNEERLSERFGPGYDILIGGESQVRHAGNGTVDRSSDNGFCDLSDTFITKIGRGQYAMQRAFRVPDALQGADSLDVTLSFEGFDMMQDNGAFTLDFTAQKTEVPVREIDCTGVEHNGIRLVSATASPTITCIMAEYPENYVNPACGAVFGDGISIGGVGGTDMALENGMTRDIGVYAGLREDETRNIVWRLFDKNGSHQEEAVFVLDFQNGTARVGSEADLKEPPVGDYACGVEAIKNLEEGYIVDKLHMEQGKPTLWIASASRKREELAVEIWQDGALADSIDTQGINGWDERTRYFEYGPPGNPDWVNEEELATPYSSWILILRDSYVNLDMARPLTVKAYNAAGELVLDEEITLEIKE